MKFLKIIILLLLLQRAAFAQNDSCWTVLLLEKGEAFKPKEHGSSLSSTGFYLYRNVVYQITTKSGAHYSGRLADIKPDSLYFTNYFNANVAAEAGATLDTFGLHYRQLDKLHLIADRALGFYTKVSFNKFNFIFEKAPEHCLIPSEWVRLYKNDTAHYELVPHLTYQGINLLYEEGGRTYYFYGTGLEKPDPSKMDATYTIKNGIWFTPNHVEKINGIAIGLMAKNIKNDYYQVKDSLVINGLNLGLNPFGFFALFNPQLVGPYPDSLQFYNQQLKKRIETTINGLNLSVVNTISEVRLNGVSISSAITVADEVHGLSISGLSNFAYIVRGLSIAGLHNRVTSMKGLQIGLYTKATDLRGVQLGLWNVNGKRSLPFINWQFRERKP